MTNIFVADFEATISEPSNTYSFGIANIDATKESEVKYIINKNNPENLIKDAIDEIFSLPNNSKVYFHNLTYDISFIMSYLFNYEPDNFVVFDSLFIGLSKNIIKCVVMRGAKKIEFLDSYCLFNAKLDDILKNYTSFKKGDTPLYKTLNDVVYNDELERYQRIDVVGLAVALKHRLTIGKNALTTAGGALKEYKAIFKQNYGDNFRAYFPLLNESLHNDIKKAYRGGFTYVNRRHQREILKDVSVIDVNSMYPKMMKDRLLPYGKPLVVDGIVKLERKFPLGIQKFSIDECEIKDDCVPFIAKSHSMLVATNYITIIDKREPIEDRTFYLTLEEFELFKKSYNYKGLKHLGGYLFSARKGFFDGYIDKFWSMKLSLNPVERSLGKLFLNALYGKFGESYLKKQYEYCYDEHLSTVQTGEEIKECGYIPMALFITSYSRLYLIDTILKIGVDNFVYCDTDSIHYLGDLPPDIDIDNSRLGAWKVEKIFKKAKYIRAKRYMGITEDGKTNIACAGIKANDIKRQIKTLEQFVEGYGISTFEMKSGVNGKYSRNKVVKI